MSRAVMQQALEALEWGSGTYDRRNAAIIALKQALAEPEQEPVGWQWLDTANYRKKLPVNAIPEHWRPLYTTPTPQHDTDCHLQGICQRSGYSIAPTPRKPDLEALNAELVEALQRYHRIVCANAIDLDCDAAIDKAHAALAKWEASK